MNKYSNESRLAKGFGILLAVGFIIFVVLMISGCAMFRNKGEPESMLERGQQICKDTNGDWVDHGCIYPAWQMVDTTKAVEGVEA